MKTRAQKDHTIETLKEVFSEAPNALVIGFQGIKVADDERLRRELRQAQLSYYVVKNTLAIRAAKGTAMEHMEKFFTGSTAVAVSKGDPVTLAKVLSKWAKESAAVKLKAGLVEGRPVAGTDVEAIAALPSKEELVSKIMFLINSGAQRLAVATAGVARNLTIVVDQVRAQKEAQGA